MLNVENIIQFVVLLGGIASTFIRFNNKTQKNSIMVRQLEKDIRSVKIEHEKDLNEIKREHKEDVNNIYKKIDSLEDEIRKVYSVICEVKVLLEANNKK